MALATRLLMAGGGRGGFTPPPVASGIVDLTASPQGGAIVVNAPWAVHRNGKVYVVYVRGDNGNIEIVSYDVASDTTSSPFVLHAALQADNHAAPSVCVLASGYIVVAYVTHDGTPIHIRVSSNPEDITAWEAEQNQDHGSNTYCNLWEVTDEGKLYLFFRWEHGYAELTYIVSTDGGNTWSADASLYAVSGQETYWHTSGNGTDRVDFVVTDVVPTVGGGTKASLGHFYLSGGVCYKSDGTVISASRPFAFSAVTKIIDGPTVDGWCFPFDISPIGPTVSVNVYKSGGDNGYWDARWTGGAWQTGHIADAGGVFYGQQAPGLSHDRADPDHCIAGILVGSDWQAVAFSSADNGATWTEGEQLTATSAPTVHVWFQSVIDAPSAVRHVMLSGTYTTDSSWATGISGANW